jgi:hypothetical protein
MELTLIKTQTYKLEPYGHFVFKWNRPKGILKPHQILVSELRMYHDSAMPLTEDQENAFVKEMKKYKTDVFTDGEKFYTRTNSGMTEVYHVRLYNYKIDKMYRSLVDATERFS